MKKTYFLLFFLASSFELNSGFRPPLPTSSDYNKHLHHSSKISNKDLKSIDLRLPEDLLPSHYVVKIKPHIDKESNFMTEGYVEVTFKVKNPTSEVVLHISDLVTKNDTIQLVDSSDQSSVHLNFISHSYDHQREFYTGILDSTLEQGRNYTFSMNYTGYLNDNMEGFYRSSYKKDQENNYIAVTQFQPTDARKAFPCFDEPNLKASFSISIAGKGTKLPISNMPLESIYFEGENLEWAWHKFSTTLPMSTYLVAFAVTDFASIQSNGPHGVQFKVWAREEAIDSAFYANEIGPELLNFYELYFEIPFPLPKQDMLALPDFSHGAMENWGLITYREANLLYDPQVGSANDKHLVGLVVAHELAHQWFGDLVSPQWWDYLWLNEGFASYMECVGLDNIETSFKALDQCLTSQVHQAFLHDGYVSSHPVYAQVYSPDEIDQLFDEITYFKGASVIRMMYYFLTENTFRKGITNYLTEMSYKSASQDDLWHYLTLQAHEDGVLDESLTVKEIMDSWILKMGYPVVNVTRNEDGSALLTQERFLLGKNKSSSIGYTWWIPLTHTHEGNPNFEDTSVPEWMNEQEASKVVNGLPTQDQWVIFNIQEGGFYRVNYDLSNWALLTSQLKTELAVISSLNRAQIIDDALDLSRGGYLDYDIAMDLIGFLVNERDLVPWQSAVNNLEYQESMFSTTEEYSKIKDYFLELSIPTYDDIGFEDSLDAPHVDQLLRSLIVKWACLLGHEPCLSNSVNLFREWMEHPEDLSIISPNLKVAVYCTGIAEGGTEEWDFTWDRYINSNSASDQKTFLSSLGCSRNTTILMRYLEMAYTEGSGIRKQDSYTAFSSVAMNDYGRDLAWDFLRNNWDDIYDYYGSSWWMAYMVNKATKEFNTEEKLAELRQLETADQSDVDFVASITNVENNIDWMDNSYDVILNWLTQNGY